VLKTTLLHPEILAALGASGHGSQVLVSDGNFPHQTAPYPGAVRVYLNLSPGRLTVSEVLDALIQAIPIERAALMDPEDDADARPAAHDQVARLLPPGTPVDHIRRHDFYAATTTSALALVVATADMRPYANVLLTIGVVPANSTDVVQ
jgi:L-fucose mutarotase